MIGTALREGPPLIAALVAALVATREVRTVAPAESSRDALYLLSFLSWVACVWLGVSSVVQIASALRADGRQKQFESPRDLAGCLHVLHALLQAKTRDRANGHSSPLVVRLTVEERDMSGTRPQIARARRAKRSYANASHPEVVRAVLLQAGGELTSAEIVEAAQSLRPKTTAVEVNAALYRMGKRGEVAHRGAKGVRVYSLTELTEEEAAIDNEQ